MSFLKIFEKTTKKVIPRKLQRIEQSYLEARFAIFESTLTGTNYRVGIFRFLKNNFILNFLKIFEKITKNVISRKLQRIEQSYLETRFAILDCTVTVPNYRVGNFRFCEKNYYKFSENFEKNTKNVTSRKLQNFEQSYLQARFATFESTLTGTKYRVGNFGKKSHIKLMKIFSKSHKRRHISKTTRIWTITFGGKICNSLEYSDSTQLQGCEFEILNNHKNILSFLGISQKTSYLENYNDLSSHIKRQDLRRQCVRWQ